MDEIKEIIDMIELGEMCCVDSIVNNMLNISMLTI